MIREGCTYFTIFHGYPLDIILFLHKMEAQGLSEIF